MLLITLSLVIDEASAPLTVQLYDGTDDTVYRKMINNEYNTLTAIHAKQPKHRYKIPIYVGDGIWTNTISGVQSCCTILVMKDKRPEEGIFPSGDTEIQNQLQDFIYKKVDKSLAENLVLF